MIMYVCDGFLSATHSPACTEQHTAVHSSSNTPYSMLITQNPYYDYTRALINDYTELVDDMLWVISKVFLTQQEMAAREAGGDPGKESSPLRLSEYVHDG